MKNLFLISSFFLLVSCDQSIDIECLPSNLSGAVIAFYPFSDGSINDFSGRKHDLINSTGVSFGQDRKNNPNCAARFNASIDQYLTTNGTFADNVQNNALSISLWSNPEYVVKSDYELVLGRAIEPKLFCPDKFGEWSLGLYDCRRPVGSINKRSIWEEMDSIYLIPGVRYECFEEHDDNTNRWKHIVFTFENDIRKIYIDGVLQRTTQSSGNCGTDSQNIGDIFIGKLYTGYIDDIILFNKELTQEEVLQLYNLEPCCN